MPNPMQSDPVVSSVLDRLLEGDDASAPTRSRAQQLRDMKQCVRRDLENLLNTRLRCKSLPANPGQLEQSLVNYGIPDLMGANLDVTAARTEFKRVLEKAIARHEPRFYSVKVMAVDNPDPTDRTLRFRIDGKLRADPVPEPVQFDMAVSTSTASFSVKRLE